MDTLVGTDSTGLMDIEAVQKVLNRSRASVYRYANTDPSQVNRPYDVNRLNPEFRLKDSEPLRFHPNEVARFAKDVLGIKPITITVQEAPPSATQELLQAILVELRGIRQWLETQSH
jgi:hypothetical protein